MHFVEFYSPDGPRFGLLKDQQVIDVARLGGGLPSRMLSFIEAGESASKLLSERLGVAQEPPAVGWVADVSLGPPLPNASKLICVAGNYREHIVESGYAAPEPAKPATPQFFSKFPSTCIIGPTASIPYSRRNVAMDWELELAVVVGRRAKDVPAETALDYVFGYTIINDISERKLNSDLPNRTPRPRDAFFDWLNGKWFDGSAPLGPSVATREEIADPQQLGMKLEVNGELMQCSSTRWMIFTVADLIASISQYVTLEPGDLIATGTPEGTGASRGRFLRPGDIVKCTIERIGILENQVSGPAA